LIVKLVPASFYLILLGFFCLFVDSFPDWWPAETREFDIDHERIREDYTLAAAAAPVKPVVEMTVEEMRCAAEETLAKQRVVGGDRKYFSFCVYWRVLRYDIWTRSSFLVSVFVIVCYYPFRILVAARNTRL